MLLYQQSHENHIFFPQGIYFYDEDGHYQLTTYCNKRLAKYDMVKNAILIPAKGIKIQTNSDDDDDDENENSNNKYSKSKPQYMTFKKRAMKNLHYLI